MEEHRKTILEGTNPHADALKALKDEALGMKWALRDSLQRTM